MANGLAAALPGTRLTDDYVRSLGRVAYLWGWPMANMHNRRLVFAKLPGPGLIDGVVPGSSLGSLSMLHDYISPNQKHVACPNQHVVYGAGILDAQLGPSVVQAPNCGERFWVDQAVDQRTESFVRLGAMYGTKPGMYLLGLSDWSGEIPAGITDAFRYDTRVAIVQPRVFMDDTDSDRSAVQSVLNQNAMYPTAQFAGDVQTRDWSTVPRVPSGDTPGEEETPFVLPEQFFADIVRDVPARPGDEALYAWFSTLVDAAHANHLADVLRSTAVDANTTLIAELFQFRNIGIPSTDHWSTQLNGAAFGVDYLSRTAMDKANIFVNSPNETAYFRLDLDENGDRLNGAHTYSLTFPGDGGVPPVKGFWSVTLYNKHHFFNPNEFGRYSLGTKNNTLQHNDGSLTLLASVDPPTDTDMYNNWLPAPANDFSLSTCLLARHGNPERQLDAAIDTSHELNAPSRTGTA
jgi:hypothetical protein